MISIADIEFENPMVSLPDGSLRRSTEILQSASLMNQLREPQSGELASGITCLKTRLILDIEP